MATLEKTPKKFSVIKRAESLTYAGRGIWVFLKSTHNVWVHGVVFIIAIVAGIYCGISSTDWMMIILASGLVFAAEAFNTAIEIDIDLTSPDYHPYARDTKDVAAGAVLISAITAGIIGVLVFGPYILAIFQR